MTQLCSGGNHLVGKRRFSHEKISFFNVGRSHIFDDILFVG